MRREERKIAPSHAVLVNVLVVVDDDVIVVVVVVVVAFPRAAVRSNVV